MPRARSAIALAAVLLAAGAGATGLGLAHAQVTAPPAATPPVVAPPIGPVVDDDSKPAVVDAPPEEAAPPPPAAPADMAVDVAPQPVLPPEPLKRPRFTSAVLQATDKITAETLRFEARVGEPVRYKGLLLTVRACETTAADEEVFDSAAHLEISAQPETPGPAPVAPRQVFRGWMFAGSPGLHPLQSPGYDVWLIACRTEAPPAPAGNA